MTIRALIKLSCNNMENKYWLKGKNRMYVFCEQQKDNKLFDRETYYEITRDQLKDSEKNED